MKKYAIIAALMLIASAFQCANNVEPQQDDGLIAVAYEETQCADPWQRGNQDAQTLRNVESFLRDKGIRFSGTRITTAPSGLITCLACNCTSGRRIEGKVHKDDLTAIRQHGFTPQTP